MKLKRHREDAKFMFGRPAFEEISKRYQHLISWAEAVLSPANFANYRAMERRERIVLKDAEVKK